MELRRWRPGRAFRRPFPSAHPHTRRAQSKQQREPRGEAVARRNRRSGIRASEPRTWPSHSPPRRGSRRLVRLRLRLHWLWLWLRHLDADTPRCVASTRGALQGEQSDRVGRRCLRQKNKSKNYDCKSFTDSSGANMWQRSLGRAGGGQRARWLWEAGWRRERGWNWGEKQGGVGLGRYCASHFRGCMCSSESLRLWPADAPSAGLAISAPSAPAEPCLAGGGASSPVGDGAGLSRGAAAPCLPAAAARA